jgi:hypothetical protein
LRDGGGRSEAERRGGDIEGGRRQQAIGEASEAEGERCDSRGKDGESGWGRECGGVRRQELPCVRG